jgi:hypothetical protein
MIRKFERTLDSEMYDVLKRRLACDAVTANNGALDISV